MNWRAIFTKFILPCWWALISKNCDYSWYKGEHIQLCKAHKLADLKQFSKSPMSSRGGFNYSYSVQAAVHEFLVYGKLFFRASWLVNSFNHWQSSVSLSKWITVLHGFLRLFQTAKVTESLWKASLQSIYRNFSNSLRSKRFLARFV